MKKHSLIFSLFCSLFILASCSEDKFVLQSDTANKLRLGAMEDGYAININDLRLRDPFILADQNTNLYYLYVNGGNKVRAYSSKDLSNWKDIGDVFVPDANFWANSDFWAPDVYLYNNKYYMFLTLSNNGNNRGTSILVADSAVGPFVPLVNQAVTPQGQLCLDGSLFVDSGNKPWILYSHEWLQVIDGKILAQRLSDDLTTVVGSPVELFKATAGPWVGAITSQGVTGYITDAPFVHKTDDGKLVMLWSSFRKDGKYAIGQAYSQSGDILGPWIQEPYSLNSDDGGHAMIFKDFHDKLKITYHAPNSQTETLVVHDIFINNGKVSLTDDTRIYEEFDGNLVNNTVGDFYFNNYDPITSSWTSSIDNTGRLSGANSLKLNIINSGADFWTLQMRTANVKMKQGNKYRVKLKAIAEKNVTFEFRSEGTVNYVQQISLIANQAKDISFELPTASATGISSLFFAFGNTGNNYNVWLDAIEVEPIEPNFVAETLVAENFNGSLVGNIIGALSLNNYSTSNSSWTYQIDNTNRLGDGNSIQLDVTSSGTDFWTLQLRTGDINIDPAKKYFVSFKAMADKNVTIDFRSEGPLSHIEKIHLSPNIVRTFNFELSAATVKTLGVMFFAFGNTGGNYKVWIDTLKIESRKY